MANYITRLGRNASNAAQWGTKAGKLLGAAEIDYVSTELTNRFSPAAFDVTRATTATRVNPSGLIESVQANVPRICYLNDDKGELLVEPQRTNLVTYSEQFDNAAWSKTSFNGGTAPTVTANQAVAPDGTTTADQVDFPAQTGSEISSLQQTGISQTNLVGTIYVRAVSGTVSNLVLRTGNQSISVPEFGTDWVRIEKDTITNPNLEGLALRNRPSSSGDGSAISIYVWGAQVEEGSYATSYIKTEATTQTRNADVISQTGLANLLGDAEGSLYIEASWFDITSVFDVFALSDGSSNNQFSLGTNTSGDIILRNIVGGSTVGAIDSGVKSNNTFYKVAGRYATNDFALYIDGSSEGTDTSGSTFSDGTLTSLSLFSIGGGSAFYGRIRQLAIFDQALTDAQLASITS